MKASLLEEFKKGSPRALSRLMSAAENRDEAVCGVLASLYAGLGKARTIGITGPPGAGKSTITGSFLRFLRQKGKRVAVIAVDPMSPFSGGALLGDRIRLVDHFNDPGVFIRSLSTRGRLGGLSLATREVVQLADAFGMDYVIVETVGVGQSEVDVRKIVDATLVVLVPEWGDAIQTLKAGLLEIGDLFVVNKSDREGADRLVMEMKSMLQMANKDGIPVLASNFKDEETRRLLFDTVEACLDRASALKKERSESAARETAYELLESLVLEEAREWVDRNISSDKNPYEFLLKFRKSHPRGTLFRK